MQLDLFHTQDELKLMKQIKKHYPYVRKYVGGETRKQLDKLKQLRDKIK